MKNETKTALINKINAAQENVYEKANDGQTLQELEEITTPGFIYSIKIDDASASSYTNASGIKSMYDSLRFNADPNISGIAFMDAPKMDYALNHNRIFKDAKDPFRQVLTLYKFSSKDLSNLTGNLKTAFVYEQARLNRQNALGKSLFFNTSVQDAKSKNGGIFSVSKASNWPSLAFFTTKLTDDATWLLVYRKLVAEMLLKATFTKPSEFVNKKIIGPIYFNENKPLKPTNFNYTDLIAKITDHTSLDDLRNILATYETKEGPVSNFAENEEFVRELKDAIIINDVEFYKNPVRFETRYNDIINPRKEVTELYEGIRDGRIIPTISEVDNVINSLLANKYQKIAQQIAPISEQTIEDIIDFLQTRAGYYWFDELLLGIEQEFRDFAMFLKEDKDIKTFKSNYGFNAKDLQKWLISGTIPNEAIFSVLIDSVEKEVKTIYPDFNYNDRGIWSVLRENDKLSSFNFEIAVTHYPYVFGKTPGFTTKLIPLNIYEDSSRINFRRWNRFKALNKNGEVIYDKDSAGNIRTWTTSQNETIQIPKYVYSSLVPYDYYNRKDKAESWFEAKQKQDPSFAETMKERFEKALKSNNEAEIRFKVTGAKLALDAISTKYNSQINLNSSKFQDLFAYTALFVEKNDLLKNSSAGSHLTQPVFSKSEDIAKFESAKAENSKQANKPAKTGSNASASTANNTKFIEDATNPADFEDEDDSWSNDINPDNTSQTSASKETEPVTSADEDEDFF